MSQLIDMGANGVLRIASHRTAVTIEVLQPGYVDETAGYIPPRSVEITIYDVEVLADIAQALDAARHAIYEATGVASGESVCPF